MRTLHKRTENLKARPPQVRQLIGPDHLLMTRDDVFSDREWYNSVQFADYLRRSELDHLLVSLRRLAIGPEVIANDALLSSEQGTWRLLDRRRRRFVGETRLEG